MVVVTNVESRSVLPQPLVSTFQLRVGHFFTALLAIHFSTHTTFTSFRVLQGTQRTDLHYLFHCLESGIAKSKQPMARKKKSPTPSKLGVMAFIHYQVGICT